MALATPGAVVQAGATAGQLVLLLGPFRARCVGAEEDGPLWSVQVEGVLGSCVGTALAPCALHAALPQAQHLSPRGLGEEEAGRWEGPAKKT